MPVCKSKTGNKTDLEIKISSKIMHMLLAETWNDVNTTTLLDSAVFESVVDISNHGPFPMLVIIAGNAGYESGRKFQIPRNINWKYYQQGLVFHCPDLSTQLGRNAKVSATSRSDTYEYIRMFRNETDLNLLREVRTPINGLLIGRMYAECETRALDPLRAHVQMLSDFGR